MGWPASQSSTAAPPPPGMRRSSSSRSGPGALRASIVVAASCSRRTSSHKPSERSRSAARNGASSSAISTVCKRRGRRLGAAVSGERQGEGERAAQRRAGSTASAGCPAPRARAGSRSAPGRCRGGRPVAGPGTWKNSSKTSAWCSGAMPIPVSVTATRSDPPGSRVAVTPTRPRSVNFSALPTRLRSTWASSTAVGRDLDARAGASKTQLDRVRGDRAQRRAQLGEQRRPGRRCDGGPQRARLGPGEVEQPVDQAQQLPGRLGDQPDLVGLRRRSAGRSPGR